MKIVSEVVKVFDVKPVQVVADEELRFRLEVSKELDSGIYVGKVYRLETYRLQPTFPQKDEKLPDIMNDALIYLVDEVFDSEILKGKNLEDVVKKFEETFLSIFGQTRG